MGTLLNFLKRRGNTKPANDEFKDAAADLEARAERLRAGIVTTDTTYSTAELIDSIAKFVRALGFASKVGDRATRMITWLTVVGLILAGTNVWLVWVQIKEANKATSTQNSIALNGQFFHDPINLQIIDAIENHKPILIEHGGHTTPTELDNYLGDLDTVDSAYADRQISEEQLCESYSTIVAETFDYPEIKKYLRDNTGYFGGAVELRDIVKKSKLDDCH